MVLNKCIDFWLENCRSFYTSKLINQRNNNPDKVHMFFDRNYQDCLSLLYEERGQNKIVLEHCTFLFQIRFDLPFLHSIKHK